MLLAGLERQAEAPASLGVTGLPHDPAREFTEIFLLASHEADIRTTEGHRDAKALAVSDSDVSPPFGGSLQDA